MPNVYYKLYYHIIWGTKNRMDLIDDEIEKLLKQFTEEKIKSLGGIKMELNTYKDHCHLLLIIPPQKSISDFIGQVKGYTSHSVNEINQERCLQWQKGFGVLSLSKRDIPFVKRYIRNQKQHHEQNNVIKALEFIPEKRF